MCLLFLNSVFTFPEQCVYFSWNVQVNTNFIVLCHFLWLSISVDTKCLTISKEMSRYTSHFRHFRVVCMYVCSLFNDAFSVSQTI
jgi:hypothetical protein